MAKLYATEAAQRVIDTAVQIHGGDGVRSGHPVETLPTREIRALRIYEGASDVQRVVIARSLHLWERVNNGKHQARPRPRMSTPSRATTCRRSDQWPELLLDRPEFQYPDALNAAVELTDRTGREAALATTPR